MRIAIIEVGHMRRYLGPEFNPVGRVDSSASSHAILLLEANDLFADQMREFLASYGMRVERSCSVGDVQEILRRTVVVAVVVGRLPPRDEFIEALPRLRRVYKGPLLVLLDDDRAVDTVLLLNMAADDVLDKQRGPRELLARLRAVIRRYQPVSATSPDRPSPAAETLPDEEMPPVRRWTLNHPGREIHAPNGDVVQLTSAEFDVLAYLASHRGELVTRADLAKAYGGRWSAEGRSRLIDGMISRIRGVLAPHLSGKSVIKSVRGRGYIFTGFDLEVVERQPTGRHATPAAAREPGRVPAS